MEGYKEIPDFPGYYINKKGDIVSTKSGKPKKVRKLELVQLSVNGKKHTSYVSSLLKKTFGDPAQNVKIEFPEDAKRIATNQMYAIDRKGNVYSYAKGYWAMRKSSANKNGYLTVSLFSRTDSKNKTYYVHSLVANAFLEKPIGAEVINHKNGIKIDNRVENLEWCTQKENARHAWDMGLITADMLKGKRK